MDKELEALRKQALEVIQALPEEKRIKLWNILHRLNGGGQHG